VKRIPRSQALVTALDATLRPALTVAAGERFAVGTEDASHGLLRFGDLPPTPESTPYARHAPGRANPVGGPVHVEGVRAGACVRVDIASIELADGGASWSRSAPPWLADWAELAEPFAARVEHTGAEAVVSERLRWPLAPMIGVLACAPEWEVRASSVGQGPWGGNLDVPEYRAGASVWLNAYHDGGLLFVGDVHGCQGDGELIGTGDESRAEVVLSAQPDDRSHLPAPRVVTEERLVALGIGRPLEHAAQAAARHLLTWLVDEHGFSRREAYLTAGLCPEFRLRVYQMTAIEELRYVVGASVPRAAVER
jgi:acetamidase/formamidase